MTKLVPRTETILYYQWCSNEICDIKDKEKQLCLIHIPDHYLFGLANKPSIKLNLTY